MPEIDVERTCEEKEAEHAVEESVGEIDPRHELDGPATDWRDDGARDDQYGGEEQRDRHQAHGLRQLQKASVQVTEEGHQDDQHREQVELSHAISLGSL